MRVARKARWKVVFVVALVGGVLPAVLPGLVPLAVADDENRPGNDQQEAAAGDAVDYWIGVRCAELPPLLRAQLDLPEGQGVLVDEVVADSPAQKSGLKAYDVIFAVDGKPVAEPQAVAEAVGRAGKNEISIDYMHAGRKQTVSLKPAPRPESIAPQQQDQHSVRQWLERLGHGPAPMNFRFVHPGMVVPRGGSLVPPLPDDMTVTIEKQGDKPAKITAKQGDKNWETNEGALDKLPPEAREFAERMLGLGAFDLGMQPVPQTAPGLPPRLWTRDPNTHVERRLDEMSRQIDELRRAFDKLQSEK
ncbi:MAG TPA: PDZ domain-containing protein [Pirellulales bacterium]|nr:PDZ domain-containing protein [Pirellulales bacterium]